MRHDPADEFMVVEFHRLRGAKLVHTSIFEHAASHTWINADDLKPQVRISLKASGKVVAQTGLALNPAIRTSRQLGHERRTEVNVIAVMPENALQVMGVPGVDPLLAVMLKIDGIHGESGGGHCTPSSSFGSCVGSCG